MPCIWPTVNVIVILMVTINLPMHAEDEHVLFRVDEAGVILFLLFYSLFQEGVNGLLSLWDLWTHSRGTYACG